MTRIVVLSEHEASKIVKEAAQIAVSAALNEWERLAKEQEINDPLLTKKEAGALLNVSVSTIDNLYNTGKLKGYRIASSVRFKRSELLEYIEQNQIE
ncbi:MAG: helix-turn-helix domain-containing protein [bacterium]|jgi:excisionase family DNA binding protein|nr:helix-turn-helix domain-containing protein [bacterium]